MVKQCKQISYNDKYRDGRVSEKDVQCSIMKIIIIRDKGKSSKLY